MSIGDSNFEISFGAGARDVPAMCPRWKPRPPVTLRVAADLLDAGEALPAPFEQLFAVA